MNTSKTIKKLATGVALTLSTFLLVLAVNATAGTEQKITICHTPPGNPTNKTELKVSANAANAHMAHGDNIGPCTPPLPEEDYSAIAI
jgi:hypothetical protein